MTAQDYIQSKLEELRQPDGLCILENNGEIERAVFKALMSKKFRKYSVDKALEQHIKQAIHLHVENNEPINITFVHGAYKLWRLQESPEVDWAELFSLMYYTKWVKVICEVHKPGVWFDFFLDDLIISRLNNIDVAEIHKYIKSYQELMDFLKQYQPSNLHMTITPVTSRFDSETAFYEDVDEKLQKITANGPDGLSACVDPPTKEAVELNVRLTDQQRQDPKWAEKVCLLYNAYIMARSELGYCNNPEKILAACQPRPSGTRISVGSTKDSVMKFWIGAGVLKKRDGSYRRIIHSSNQLDAGAYNFEDVNIKGLSGKNFQKIRIAK